MNTLGIKLAWIFSAAFLLVTVIGFIPNPIIGEKGIFLTNTAHNLVHLLTALGFAVVAVFGNTPSIFFHENFWVCLPRRRTDWLLGFRFQL